MRRSVDPLRWRNFTRIWLPKASQRSLTHVSLGGVGSEAVWRFCKLIKTEHQCTWHRLLVSIREANGLSPQVAAGKSDRIANENLVYFGVAGTVFATVAGAQTPTLRIVGVRSNDVLKMREWPIASSRVVGTIPPDATGVRALGRTEHEWAFVQYGNVQGWVGARS